MYKFAKTSEGFLEEVHHDLRLIAYTVKTWADIDFDVSCGRRSIEEQGQLYQIGRTTQKGRRPVTEVDGVTKLSKHNQIPSLAIDIYAYNGKMASYTVEDMCYLAGLFRAAAVELKNKGLITHGLRWGGNFDKDGEIVTDENFLDMPHFELI